MKNLVNVAVIGAGYWGKKVIWEYLQLHQSDPKVNMTMVSDLEDENLEYCNAKLHISGENATKDYKDVLGSNDVDAVHICTPPRTHYEICKEALNADKHVLLEKPMTLNSEEALELKDIASSKKLILQVGHIYRFNNSLNKTRTFIEQNYLGDLYHLNLKWTTLMPSPSEIGIIFDLAPHPIDISNDLLDKWPIKVSCKAKAYRRKSYEEYAFITMEFEGNVMAHIELSWLQPGKNRQVCIIGSERCAEIDCLNQTIKIYEKDPANVHYLEVPKNNTVLDEITNFVDSVRTGQVLQSLSVNPNTYHNDAFEGVKNVLVLESLMKSIEEERTVKLDWPE